MDAVVVAAVIAAVTEVVVGTTGLPEDAALVALVTRVLKPGISVFRLTPLF